MLSAKDPEVQGAQVIYVCTLEKETQDQSFGENG